MDFDDSGIESDPKVNSDTDTLNKNEPIISFSPERCRFDSGQTSSRKSSSGFPISVAELQLEDPIVSSFHTSSTNANVCTPNSNLHNTLVSSTVITNNSIIVPKSVPLHPPQQSVPLLVTHVQNPFHQQSSSISCAFTATSSDYGILGSGVINTHSATLNSTTSRPPLLASTTAGALSSAPPSEPHSIPLMVNGAGVLNSNNSATTLNFQQCLEKSIAPAAAYIPSTATSSSVTETRNDSILTSLTSCTGKSESTPSSSAATCVLSENGNQISFSPLKSTSSTPASAQLFPSNLSSSSSSTLWESGCEIDLWENKISSGAITDSNGSHIADGFLLDDTTKSAKVMEALIHTQPNLAQVDHTASDGNRADDQKLDNDDGGNISPGFSKLMSASTTACPEGESAVHNLAAAPCSNANVQSVNKAGSKITSKIITSGQSLQNVVNTSNSNSAPGSGSSSVNSGFDLKKVGALLPPQRLAIPSKPNPQLQSSHSTKMTGNSSLSSCGNIITTSPSPNSANGNSNTGSAPGVPTTFPATPFPDSNPGKTPSIYGSSISSTSVHKTSTRNASISETSCNNSGAGTGGGGASGGVTPSGNGNVKAGSNSSKLSSEKKPLVQWDSDESEEELSFFPPSKRGVITDNLSIDNMSLSGEEEDLHLTPPRPLAKKCPCDPRTFMERRRILSSSHHHPDPSYISSKPCIIC